MKMTLYTLAVLFAIACGNTQGKSSVGNTSHDSIQSIGKDSLLVCLKEVAAELKTNAISLERLEDIFASRQNRFRISVGFLPIQERQKIEPGAIQVYIDTSVLSVKSGCLLEVVANHDLPNDSKGIVTFKDLETVFGKGVAQPWKSAIGAPAPKEYISPIRFEISGYPGTSPFHIMAVGDHPDHKDYFGIRYIRFCY